MIRAAVTGGTDTLVPLIVAVGSSGVLVAAIQGLFTRRRTRAEVESTGASAAKAITDAAAVIVGNLQTDNLSLRSEITKLRADIMRLEARWEQAERLWDAHEEWDRKVGAAITMCTADHHYEVPVAGPPPPLRDPAW